MIKKITTSIVLLITALSFAQQSSSSPYSAFGIGEPRLKGTPEQRAMGGLGIFPDSLHLNLLNPASYSGLQLTIISIGGQTAFNELKTTDTTEKAKRTSLDYLAVGVPLGKFGVVFGLNPQTSVGYRIESNTIGGNTGDMSNKYTGEGGSNRAFIGGGYKLTSNFDIGIDANFFFGKINTSSRKYQAGTQLGTRVDNNINLNGFSVNLGAMYKTKFREKYDIYTSAVITPGHKMNFNKTVILGTITNVSGYDRFDDYVEMPEVSTEISVPTKFALGVGIGELRKWAVGTEFSFNGKNKDAAPVSGSFASFDSKEAFRVSAGGYYVPKYNSFTNYFHRITYRGGLRYENTGLVVNGTSITDKAVSIGANFPMGNGISDISLALEYGQRGAKNDGLVQENYFNVIISISIIDKWFRKMLYD